MALRYLAPALAIASGVLAASNSCNIGATATTTITNSIQASSLAACQTFSGNIAIATGAASIALDGIERISGSLIANEVSPLTSLSADSLHQIDDTFLLNNCPHLTSLTFPMLADVGAINWTSLASLQGLAFTTQVQQATSVYIADTQLTTLEGISLQTVDAITLTENTYLTSINLALTHINNGLTISSNGRMVDLSLPNLVWANALNIQNASSINLPSLAFVNETLGFYSNFASSVSCPNLTSVGSELAFVGNAQLTNVSMPELKIIQGGFLLSNNSDYKVASFPKVTTVNGAIDFYGVFTSIDLPDLDSVAGGVQIHSTGDITAACDHFQTLKNNGDIRGAGFSCAGNQSGANTGAGSITGTTSAPTATSSKSGANTVLISGTTGVLGVVAALFGML